MKKGRYLFGALITALLMLAPGMLQPTAMAQVPSGVMVDSIGPATSWRNETPFRSHHLVADPKTGKMVFITGQASGNNNGLDPAWYYSTDNGTTWSVNTAPFQNNSQAGAVAVAADSNFNIYVAFNRGDSLFFNKDVIGDGSGLLADVLVNAPGAAAQCADIAVSRGGQHIIITAQPTHGDYDSLYAYVSTDGGNTWTQKLALTTDDPSVAPAAYGSGPTFQWDVTSLSMGSNGYAFVAAHANYDTTYPDNHWYLISETTDYGTTWTPSWVTPPDTNNYKPVGSAWDNNGPVVAVGNTPHIATMMQDKNGVQIMVECHRENGTWVYHTLTHPDSLLSLSYEIPRDPGLGADSQGRLYCVWTDENLSVNSTYQIFVSGSSDGGDTWTNPVRLTDAQTSCSGNAVLNSPQIPQLMASTSAAVAINGNIYGLFPGQNPPTAWVEAQFPLSAVWSGPFDRDTTRRVLKADGYASTFGTTGYSWMDITKTGTEVDSSLHDIPSGSYDPDDGCAGPYPIGFDFVLYNRAFHQFQVFANGFISFTDSTGMNWPPPFPINKDTTMIAVLGSDPNHDIHNPQLYYWTNSAQDTCVIEWYHETSYDTPNDTAMTFEIILAKKDSSVTFQYADVGPTPQTMHVIVQGQQGEGVNFNRLGFVPDSGTIARVYPSSVTPVESSPTMPASFALSQNYPNPFNPTTQINYSLPRNSFVTLKVYNVLGQEVTTLFSGAQVAGNHSVAFDASRYASGVYFYRLQAENFSSVKKMILMK